MNAFGQVTINKANGNINSCVFPTAYITLGDIYLEENRNNDFAFADRNNFTLIITAPTNFEFQAGAGYVSYRNNEDITGASIAVTSTTITVTYRSNQQNRTVGDDRLTISGIQFRGVTGPSSGNMTRTGGTGNINGASNGAVFGTLTSTSTSLPVIGGGVAAVCVGSTTPAFTNATAGGTWSITNGSGAATITSGGVVTGTAAGTVTVIYSLNGCVANRSLTINPLPAAIAGGATAVCLGGSTPAFTNATGGGTWSVVSGTGNGTISAGGVLTGTSAGTVTVRYTMPSGCYTASAPITVNPLPATVITPVPANGAAGVCYAGTGAVSGISWAAAVGANSYDVYFGAGSLPGSAVNVSTNSYNTGVLLANTTYYWRVVAKNGCGDAVSSATWSFTTSGTPCYCKPTTQVPNRLFINTVAFVGTMADPPVNTPAGTGAGTNGYSEFTSLGQIAKQAQGEGVNVLASSSGVSFLRGRWKAWVDWNSNGIFENGERVYSTGGYVGQSVNFGFKIPDVQTPGNYRLRIRVNNSATCGIPNCTEGYGYDFGPCDNFTGELAYFTTSNFGETEDYLIQVVENCAAKIASVVNGSECSVTGGKAVTLKATSSKVVTEFRWYDSATGSDFVATAADGTGMGTTFITPLLSVSTNYYVTAYDGACESTFRTLVKAEIKPTPVINFTAATSDVCGESAVVSVSATGSKEIVHLVNENFEAGTLGVFTNINDDTNNTATDNLTRFQNRTSVYPAAGNVWFPAISSGFGGNKFALATADVNPVPANPVINSLTLSDAVNTSNFDNLTLKFRIYYSRYLPDNDETYNEYVKIEISTDGGVTYPNQIVKYISGKGQAGSFTPQTFDLSAYIGQANLKFRIQHYSWAGSGFLPDGIGIDDIELYGEKPLTPSFAWSSNFPIQFYSDALGTVPYTGSPASVVYIKPNNVQLETFENWNVQATASLSNGCSATGIITIQNKTKTWDTSSTDWANAAAWKPLSSNTVPTADKCVIIKSPVTIGTATDGFAKNIKIETASGATGKLDIAGSLTVTDYINNTGTDTDLVIASDANLKQVTDSPVPANSGAVTAKRTIRFRADARQEYNYLISPVVGQSLKTIYPGVPTTSTYPYVLYYNEATNFFGNSTGAYIAGRGLAVKEPSKAHVPANSMDAVFKGPLANGVITFPLGFTNNVNYGYNLVGNPYASNIDLRTLYTLNGGSLTDASVKGKIISTFYFWDNGANDIYVQQGSGYSGKAYAVYNAINNTGNAAGYLLSGNPVIGVKVPNAIAKVGQGFLVRATSAANLSFNNSIRTTDNTGANFFSKSADSTESRYWVQLITPTNLVNSIAVVHFEGGATAFGLDDSELNGSSSDMFYSIAGDHKVQIEGRSVFTDTDKIPLGSAHFTSGTYTIALGKKEGVFANGQNIYLKDKETGIITNLSAGAYSFMAAAGESTGRFEIIYQPEAVLATDAAVKEDIQVYRDGTDFVVKARSKKITRLEIYDAAGRLIRQIQPDSLKVTVDSEIMSNGTYLLKINQGAATVVKKILK